MGFFSVDGEECKKKNIYKDALGIDIDNYAYIINQLKEIEMRGNSIFPQEVQDKTALIQTIEDLNRYKEAILKNGICACDTETSGLFWYRAQLVGVCLYTPGQKAVYIPLMHKELGKEELLPNQLTNLDLKNFFLDLKDKVKIIFHNGYFDLCFLKVHLGVLVDCFWDTMICKKIMNELESASLKSLYNKEVLGKEESATTYEEVAGEVPFNFIPINIAKNYAAFDAYMTYEVFKYQLNIFNSSPNDPKLNGHYNVLMGIEMPFLPVIVKASLEGFYINKDRALELEEKYTKKLEESEIELNKLIKPWIKAIEKYNLSATNKEKIAIPLKWGSSKQMNNFLFKVKKLPRPKSLAEGLELKTTKSFLQEYDDELVKALLKYRHYRTLITTFIKKSIDCLGSFIIDGKNRLFTEFRSIGAPTGRMASGSRIGLPNVQNYPARGEEVEIKSMFVPPPHHKFISGDFSQIEPRFLADLSGDPNLIEIYHSGRQLYSSIAAKTFNLPYDECLETLPADYDTSKLMHPESLSKNIDGTYHYTFGATNRKKLKSTVMGIMFSRGSKAIAAELKITIEEAKKIIKDFYNTFPTFHKWKLSLIDEVKKNGYLSTTYGRTRHFPITYSTPPYEFFKAGYPIKNSQADSFIKTLSGIKYKEQKAKYIAELESNGIKVIDNTVKIMLEEKQFVNLKISGSAADTLKLTAIAVDKELYPLGCKMINFIHDEIWLTMPEDKVDEIYPKFKHLMENSTRFLHDEQGIKLLSDIKVTDNWD